MSQVHFSTNTGSMLPAFSPALSLTKCSTEKAPGMFATLVIAMPSEHTGGDVVVQLRDEE